MPVAFGWHPYFALPDVPRADWVLRQPFTRRVVLDDRCIPTGALEDVAASGPGSSRTFDDLFTEVVPGTSAWISGRSPGRDHLPDGLSVRRRVRTAGRGSRRAGTHDGPNRPVRGRFPPWPLRGDPHGVFAIEVAVDDPGMQS